MCKKGDEITPFDGYARVLKKVDFKVRIYEVIDEICFLKPESKAIFSDLEPDPNRLFGSRSCKKSGSLRIQIHNTSVTTFMDPFKSPPQ